MTKTAASKTEAPKAIKRHDVTDMVNTALAGFLTGDNVTEFSRPTEDGLVLSNIFIRAEALLSLPAVCFRKMDLSPIGRCNGIIPNIRRVFPELFETDVNGKKVARTELMAISNFDDVAAKLDKGDYEQVRPVIIAQAGKQTAAGEKQGGKRFGNRVLNVTPSAVGDANSINPANPNSFYTGS